jgi:hypothetical protein
MKRCPQCNRTYTDDALSFCLDDGSPLVSAAAPSSFDPGATVQYPQARDTSPPPTVAYPGAQSAPPPPVQPPLVQPPPTPPPGWSPMPTAAPPKRSVWPWLLGIGAVLVFLGIGVVILIFAIASITNANNNNHVANNNTNGNRNSNRNTTANRNTNDNSNSNENTNTRSSLTSFTDDFSEQTWWTGPSAYGRVWYDNEEYHMHAITGRYIVMYAPDKPEYHDENATVRVGLRSIDGDPPETGYGLVVHGEKKTDNLEDYGFLIYNGPNPKYKIVLHRAGNETKLVDWTASSTIRTGTLPNQLEVRIRDTKMDLYINGQFVTSIVDEAGYKRGRVGFYTSDKGEVAFDDLEINK